MDELRAIVYSRGSLKLLDQRKLPLQSVYVDVKGANDGWSAIKEMVVRGAPAIAIAAALSLAVEVSNAPETTARSALTLLKERLDFLVTSRPTAVNLADASEKLKRVSSEAAGVDGATSKQVYQAYITAAEAMLEEDVASNKAIGHHGSEFLLKSAKNGIEKLNVLTHCNTGSLATAGYGTALGVIRALHSGGHLKSAYCTETRPYNQGSRLTAYELVQDNIPATLVADSAAAALAASGKVDAIVVGADRVAANGDTANKIGTYNLAVSALHHGIPFYIAAPLTSIDLSISSGADIKIEERSPKELICQAGPEGKDVIIGEPRIAVWNPAFDVTPAALISGIITDKGVITKAAGSSTFDIPSFVHSLETRAEEKQGTFYALTEAKVAAYVQSVPQLASRLGGDKESWKIQEVGDGNLNYVYIIVGPKGSFVLKQALPYIRCVGESWPMTIERAYFESTALEAQRQHSPEHVPEVYHFDHSMALTVMEYLKPPHKILRKGLIAGEKYPSLAEHMSDYMAKTLFRTSLLNLSTTEHKAAVAKFCGNVELCRLTEQVVFTEPYMVASNNHWTSPQLDEDAKAIREDDVLKLEIAGLKSKFCTKPQALIHGDLHTGSIMVTSTSTQVIDPEFAFYGPMGFDVGAFLGNLILAYCSQDGHATNDDDRSAYKGWLSSVICDSWNLFKEKFLALWKEDTGLGDAYPSGVYNSMELQKLAQQAYVKELFEDALGFAAAKMIRRIVGIAHVEDLESIGDADMRAKCERWALNVAKKIMKTRTRISSIEGVIEAIESAK